MYRIKKNTKAMIGYLAMDQMNKIRTNGSTLKPFEPKPELKPFTNQKITPSYYVHSRDPTKRINTLEPPSHLLPFLVVPP